MAKKQRGNIYIQNLAEVKKSIEWLSDAPEQITKAVISDIRTRAPGWVNKAIISVYAISSRDLPKPSIKRGEKATGTVSLKGETFDSLYLHYEGRMLTMSHFRPRYKAKKPYYLRAPIADRLQLKQKSRFKQIKKSGANIAMVKVVPYQVSVTVFKGHSKKLHGKYPTGMFQFKGKQGQSFPAQRIPGGSAGDLDIIRAISVPQMIENERVRAKIDKNLSEGIDKRFEQAKKRFFWG